MRTSDKGSSQLIRKEEHPLLPRRPSPLGPQSSGTYAPPIAIAEAAVARVDADGQIPTPKPRDISALMRLLHRRADTRASFMSTAEREFLDMRRECGE